MILPTSYKHRTWLQKFGKTSVSESGARFSARYQKSASLIRVARRLQNRRTHAHIDNFQDGVEKAEYESLTIFVRCIFFLS